MVDEWLQFFHQHLAVSIGLAAAKTFVLRRRVLINAAHASVVDTDNDQRIDLAARDQLIGRYADETGRDMSLINYYEVFALFKLAVVLQQIYVRFYRGQTTDERFRHFDKRVYNLLQQAAALI